MVFEKGAGVLRKKLGGEGLVWGRVVDRTICFVFVVVALLVVSKRTWKDFW